MQRLDGHLQVRDVVERRVLKGRARERLTVEEGGELQCATQTECTVLRARQVKQLHTPMALSLSLQAGKWRLDSI